MTLDDAAPGIPATSAGGPPREHRRYVVLIACDPGEWAQASDAVKQEYFEAHHAFERYVDAHGRRTSSAALCDADLATTIRRDGDRSDVVTDGPFVELVEQLSGYYDVELPDLDTAIAAAKLLPKAYTVEIRAVVGVEGYEGV
ncbi:YciI family protein [Luteipulveratus flavus]|uniref:YciI family protein n=1 Tax=Luteipulveratus flavus TaxID=3031728 RepID=A0ABT6C9U1_9MICO|nr:YciI family protein [Luteipulveratus sp. YIM 133296]MDF8265666.1 YciI family protein [Luteipulveratus sp. YIM 133296]